MEHLTFKRPSPVPRHHGGNSSPASSHKSMKQSLDRMENTVTAIPQTLGEYMDTFNTFCLSGIKLASLLETLFQDTPVLLVALRFREACEQMKEKCSKSTVVVKGEVVPPVTKKLAPSLSQLRGRIDSHAKALSKHESYAKQLESLSCAQSPNKQKLEQVENKFQTSAKDFAKEDAQLAEAMNEVHKMRVEVRDESKARRSEITQKDLSFPLGNGVMPFLAVLGLFLAELLASLMLCVFGGEMCKLIPQLGTGRL